MRDRLPPGVHAPVQGSPTRSGLGGSPLRTLSFFVLAVALATPAALLPAGATSGGITVRLVDAHTVHTIVGPAHDSVERAAPHALNTFGMALTATVATEGDGSTFSGIRWLNDQYVLDPSNTPLPPGRAAGAFGLSVLFSLPDGATPCEGSVLVVPAGNADPRGWIGGAHAAYVESYLVTDPSDHKWVTHVWKNIMTNERVALVPILNNEAGASAIPNAGSECSPYVNNAMQKRESVGDLRANRYNAELILLGDSLGALPSAPIVDHNGAVGNQHAGNSHPFNPLPEALRPGLQNHGASGVHATLDVDVYFGAGKLPAVPDYEVIDTEGSTAPFG